MPTITLTEAEASHVRNLIDRDKRSLEIWSRTYVIPEWCDSHKTVIALNERLLEKFKDA